MSTELAVATDNAVVRAGHFQDDMLERIKVVKDVIAKGTTDVELQFFSEVCRRTGLDPFMKQIYCIKRGSGGDEEGGGKALTIQTGIDGYRIIAERSGKYLGQIGPLWCGDDGKWRDCWFYKDPPMACKIGILRKDFKEPLWAVAHYFEYVQTKRNGGVTQMWSKMPAGQLAKCAESLGLRKAFPMELSGIYTTEEMPETQADDSGDDAPPDAKSQQTDSGRFKQPQRKHNKAEDGGGEQGQQSPEQTAGGHDTAGTSVKSPSAPPPADLEQLLAKFDKADTAGRILAFREAEQLLCEITGDDADWRRIMGRHGVQEPGEFRKLATARLAFKELWEAIGQHSAAMAEQHDEIR